MSFIGNDIMFFENNVNTFTRKGAVKHILNENEIADHSVKHYPIIAWTIKESIYKIICKEGYRKAFAPKKISVFRFYKVKNNKYSGEALFNNQKYFFQTQITDESIFSFATNDYDKLPEIKHHFINNNSQVSNKELEYFLHIKKWKIDHTKEGIPHVFQNQNKIDISITHDNNVIVFSELAHIIDC